MITKITNIQRPNWQTGGKKLSTNSHAKKEKGKNFSRVLEEEKAAELEKEKI